MVDRSKRMGRVRLSYDDVPVEDLSACTICYTDFSVGAGLGLKRRNLDFIRQRDCVFGRDWNVVAGEIGMCERWCVERGLDVSKLERSGEHGLTSFRVAKVVMNPRIIIGMRIADRAVFPVYVKVFERKNFITIGRIFDAVCHDSIFYAEPFRRLEF